MRGCLGLDAVGIGRLMRYRRRTEQATRSRDFLDTADIFLLVDHIQALDRSLQPTFKF
jgi:hypothetical protein